MDIIIASRRTRYLPKRMPISKYGEFLFLMQSTVAKNDYDSWAALLAFGYKSFSKPRKSHTKPTAEAELMKRCPGKAMRLLQQPDSQPCYCADITAKHPLQTQSDTIPVRKPCSLITVDPTSLLQCINKMSVTAGGFDGLTLMHIKCFLEHTGALDALVALIEIIANGRIADDVRDILYVGVLKYIPKPVRDRVDGVRPIVMENIFRKIATKYVMQDTKPAFAKNYMFAKNGKDKVIFSVRDYATKHDSCIILQIDFENAFNSHYRGEMINQVFEHARSLYPLVYSIYHKPIPLFYEDGVVQRMISSEQGCQQGDPSSSMLFSLLIQPLITSLRSELVMFFMDDGTCCDTNPDTVLADLAAIMRDSERTGLKLNPSKCTLFAKGCDVSGFQKLLPDITIIPAAKVCVLQTHILCDEYTKLMQAIAAFAIAADNMVSLPFHGQYYLLAKYGVSRLVPFFKSSKVYTRKDILDRFDDILYAVIDRMTPITVNAATKRKIHAPVVFGGLGIEGANDIALPCYLASVCSLYDITTSVVQEALQDWNHDIPSMRSTYKAWLAYSPGHPNADLWWVYHYPSSQTLVSDQIIRQSLRRHLSNSLHKNKHE